MCFDKSLSTAFGILFCFKNTADSSAPSLSIHLSLGKPFQRGRAPCHFLYLVLYTQLTISCCLSEKRTRFIIYKLLRQFAIFSQIHSVVALWAALSTNSRAEFGSGSSFFCKSYSFRDL